MASNWELQLRIYELNSHMTPAAVTQTWKKHGSNTVKMIFEFSTRVGWSGLLDTSPSRTKTGDGVQWLPGLPSWTEKQWRMCFSLDEKRTKFSVHLWTTEIQSIRSSTEVPGESFWILLCFVNHGSLAWIESWFAPDAVFWVCLRQSNLLSWLGDSLRFFKFGGSETWGTGEEENMSGDGEVALLHLQDHKLCNLRWILGLLWTSTSSFFGNSPNLVAILKVVCCRDSCIKSLVWTTMRCYRIAKRLIFFIGIAQL